MNELSFKKGNYISLILTETDLEVREILTSLEKQINATPPGLNLNNFLMNLKTI